MPVQYFLSSKVLTGYSGGKFNDIVPRRQTASPERESAERSAWWWSTSSSAPDMEATSLSPTSERLRRSPHLPFSQKPFGTI